MVHFLCATMYKLASPAIDGVEHEIVTIIKQYSSLDPQVIAQTDIVSGKR